MVVVALFAAFFAVVVEVLATAVSGAPVVLGAPFVPAARIHHAEKLRLCLEPPGLQASEHPSWSILRSHAIACNRFLMAPECREARNEAHRDQSKRHRPDCSDQPEALLLYLFLSHPK